MKPALLILSLFLASNAMSQIPVEVMDTSDDGTTFSYLLKEQIRASHEFKLVPYSPEGHLRLYVNVLKIGAGNQIAIGTTWTYMKNNYAIPAYLQSGILTVGTVNQQQAIDSCLATGDKAYQGFMADIEAAQKFMAEQEAKNAKAGTKAKP